MAFIVDLLDANNELAFSYRVKDSVAAEMLADEWREDYFVSIYAEVETFV